MLADAFPWLHLRFRSQMYSGRSVRIQLEALTDDVGRMNAVSKTPLSASSIKAHDCVGE